MMRQMTQSLAVASGITLLSFTLAAAQDRVVRSFTLADIDQIMEVVGGSMGEVAPDAQQGELEVTLTYSDGETAIFRGINCAPGDVPSARVCTAFALIKVFELPSARAASDLSANFDAAWFADSAEDRIFTIRRMDWVVNGVTLSHLGAAIDEFGRGVAVVRDQYLNETSPN